MKILPPDSPLLNDRAPRVHGMSLSGAYNLSIDPRTYDGADYRTAAAILAIELKKLTAVDPDK